MICLRTLHIGFVVCERKFRSTETDSAGRRKSETTTTTTMVDHGDGDNKPRHELSIGAYATVRVE